MGAAHITERGVLIGYEQGEVRIPWPDEQGGKLILIFGKRGTGKTQLLRGIQQAAIMSGFATFSLNAKADPAISIGSQLVARRIGKDVTGWSETGPTQYNPYARGNSMEVVDQLLAGEAAGTHPHYLRKAQRFIGHVVRVQRALEMEVTLRGIIEQWDEGAFGTLLQDADLPRSRAVKEARRYALTLNPADWEDLAGTRDRLAVIAESEAGEWWEGGPDSIDLWSAAERSEIVNFLIDSDAVPLLSEMMGTGIVLDLNTLMGHRNKLAEEGVALEHLFVFIDEFGGIPTDISRLAARGRSANVTLVLSSQDLWADTASHEGLRDRLIGNFDALVSLREQSPRSAEVVSQLSGKIEKEVTSWDERGHTRTEVREVPRIAETQVMDVPEYCGIVLRPGQPERERACIARLLSPVQIDGLRY